jgi:hypothetical protein
MSGTKEMGKAFIITKKLDQEPLALAGRICTFPPITKMPFVNQWAKMCGKIL